MAKYQTPDGNTIIADQEFIDKHYQGATLLPEPVVAEPAASWLISLGAFYDRMGSLAIPILADADSTTQAFVKYIAPRPYINLQRPDLADGLDLLISKGYAVDKTSILGTPCQAGEEP